MFSELAANLDAAAQLLVKFMNDGDRQSIAAAILEHEHVGDKIVHDIVRRLNKSFITPIDREDIYDLVATADEILDSIEEAAGLMIVYRIEREAIASLFEGDTKCTDIIKWKDIYETLESAIDECEHVANVIESIVLKLSLIHI